MRDAYQYFSVQLQNIGDASSVALYTFITYGAEIGPFGHQDLSDGFELTTALPEGDYYLSVMVDSADAVAESDESNNISAFIPVTLLNPKPDLIGYSYTNTYTELYGSAVEAGAVLSFDVSLSNNTEITAPIGATAGIYLSDDETVTTVDQLIGTIDMPGLGSYGNESGEFDFTLPQDLAEGTYYTGLIVDIDDVVEELNEENNGSDYGDQITVAGPGRVEITDYLGTDFDGVVLECVGISAQLAGRYKQTYTYDQMNQWYRDGEAVGEALDQYEDYYTSQADVGADLTVEVTYTDVNGDTASYTSAAVTVENVDDMPQGDVFIVSDAESGDFEEDATLTVNVDDLTDQDGLGDLSYQWYIEEYDYELDENVRTDIEGATDASFSPTQAEAGKNVSVDITYVDGFGNENTVENVRAKNYNTYVHNVDDPLTGEVVITGTAAEDQILTADISGVMDEDGPTGDTGYGQIYYNWFIGDNATTYSTDNTYQLTQNDVGYEVRVQIDVNDDFGGYASLLSAPTAVVENVNDAPEGELMILGDAEQGADLSLGANFSDKAGVDYTTLSYQWIRDAEAIEGATSFDYTLTQSDVGAVIGATASYTDGQGTPEMVTATDTGPVSNINDAPAGGVSLGGVAAEDGVLTADASALSDLDGLGELSYQWLRDGEAIEGATDASLALTQEDAGDRFEAVVSYTDGFGASEAVSSGSSDIVLNVNDVPTGAVTLSGDATQGSALSVDFSTVADADGYDADIARIAWQRDGVTVEGQNSSEDYRLTQADVGAGMSATISYTDGFGAEETMTSVRTTPIRNVNDAPVGTVLVTGDAITGSTLTAGADLSDEDGMGALSYQWLRGSDAIEGATGETYVLDDDDLGGLISVRVSYTDGQDMAEAVNSAQTEAVVSLSTEINGTPADERLVGGAGNDTIMGGFGGDTVIGNGGDDHLSGGALGDILFGNEGDDFLNGGFGYDRMNGGDGADTFYHLGIFNHGSDWIQDYSAADGDVLQVGRNMATRDQFQLNRANTADAQTEINLQIGTDVFDLMV